jgi:hypothetical protein
MESVSKEHGARLEARQRENMSWEEYAKVQGTIEGEYIETRSGIHFNFENPTVDMILIEDIAHALANKCRYSGHTSLFYSVAEHSIEVARRLPAETQLWGLMHDATEAYLPDVPRPIKRLMPAFRVWEQNIMRVIAHKFGLSMPEPAAVKEADTRILLDEAYHLLPSKGAGWEGVTGLKRYGDFYPRCLSPENAKDEFLDWYDMLVSQRAVRIAQGAAA